MLLLIDKPLFFFINLVRRKALRKWACGGQRNGVIWSATGKDKTESDFPLGSEVAIPEFNPTQKEGELEWGEGQRKLLRTDSTNLALWTGSLKYAMRYALAFLIYWSWPPMEITLLNVGLRKNLATLKGFWICDDESELKIKHLRWGFGDSAYLAASHSIRVSFWTHSTNALPGTCLQFMLCNVRELCLQHHSSDDTALSYDCHCFLYCAYKVSFPCRNIMV